MSWAEVFKVNSNMKKPLDKLNYELFYEMAKIANKGYGTNTSDVFIVPDYKDTIEAEEYSNYSAKVIIIPSSVKRIEAYAFERCENLESIYIPNSIVRISRGTFDGCTSLKSIRILSNRVNIDENTFPTNVDHIFVPWGEGAIAGAPWGATNAIIHYNN